MAKVEEMYVDWIYIRLNLDLDSKKSIQSHIRSLSIMTSFCQENGHLKTASDVELTEITACDTTTDFYLTN